MSACSSRVCSLWTQLMFAHILEAAEAFAFAKKWRPTQPRPRCGRTHPQILCCRKEQCLQHLQLHCGYRGSFPNSEGALTSQMNIVPNFLLKDRFCTKNWGFFVIWEGMWFLSCFLLFPVLTHLTGVSSSLIFHEVKQNHPWGNLLTARISTVSYAPWQKEGNWWENNEEISLFSWGLRFLKLSFSECHSARSWTKFQNSK